MKWIKFLFLCFFLSSCLEKPIQRPNEVLSEVVKLQFSTGMTREMLDKYFAPNLAKTYGELNDQDFDLAFNMKNRKMGKIIINSQKCTETACSLTYILSYREMNNEGVESSEVNVKKIAQFEKADGDSQVWKISDLSDVKTHIEFK